MNQKEKMVKDDYPYYVKCKYGPGWFSDHYIIQVNIELEKLYFVERRQVKPIDNENGLVKACVIKLTSSKAIARICSPFQGVVTLLIPREEVILSESELEVDLA